MVSMSTVKTNRVRESRSLKLQQSMNASLKLPRVGCYGMKTFPPSPSLRHPS